MTPKEAFKDLFLDVWKRDEETNKKQSIVLKALTELEELKRDVNRFIELLMKDNHTGRDTFDIEILKDKLMKVGNEE